ncbi:hypothetical protein Tco_0876241 [Tanacetum coccineum]|uniref:Uncharacterized protein n=1 Tax=Tanacetum coccineum TaxID=301880 RepID=A0ABQ5BRR5_9ASTR
MKPRCSLLIRDELIDYQLDNGVNVKVKEEEFVEATNQVVKTTRELKHLQLQELKRAKERLKEKSSKRKNSLNECLESSLETKKVSSLSEAELGNEVLNRKEDDGVSEQ